MRSSIRRLAFAAALASLFSPAPAAPAEAASLRDRSFADESLYLADVDEPYDVLAERLPNAAAWRRYREELGVPSRVWIDPRSGAPVNLLTRVPLLPGSGLGNNVKLADVERLLGRPVPAVDAAVAGDAVAAYARLHAEVLGIDIAQLGAPLAESVADGLWHVWVPQRAGGVPVRDAGLAATLRHGNLVLLGLEGWGDVRLDLQPRLSADEALEVGFEFAGGRRVEDRLVDGPRLELLLTAAPGETEAKPFAGEIGAGYGHRLAWTFVFQRPSEAGDWEISVDAHDARVLGLGDARSTADQRRLTGGVYTMTNTDICPSAERCGTLQSGFPMPFADTGLAGASAFTDSAGRFSASGSVTTRLRGRHVRVDDGCGPLTQSTAQGDLDLGGAEGDHACEVPVGASLGDTAGARTTFYELNKLIEMARGWIPGDAFLQGQIRVRTNDFSDRCNGAYSGATESITLLAAGPGKCRATAELAGLADHEWGHALDDHDLRPGISRPGEAYGDIVAAYRLQSSCIGSGFRTPDFQDPAIPDCGDTLDGTGSNTNNSIFFKAHCATDCSGLREIDFAKHDADGDGRADAVPDTVQNYVCTVCDTFGQRGPCNRQTHCESAAVTQAAWDLATRDLTAEPFKLDRQSAFILANRLFYSGSRNIRNWYSCGCARGKAHGCRSHSGFMQWLAADDDNGSLDDGTPHLGALRAAFGRHGIACSEPLAPNSGCAGAPTAAPSLAAFPGDEQVALQWSPVAGATRYRVFRAEGLRACEDGKTLIGTTAGTSFTDAQVMNGRRYSYLVAADNGNDACLGPASNCAGATPREATFSLSCPGGLSVPRGGSGGVACTFSASPEFTGGSVLPVCFPPAGGTCGFSASPVFLAPGQTKTVTLTVHVSASAAPGNYGFTVTGTSGGVTQGQALNLNVPSFGLACDPSSLTAAPGGSATTGCVFTGASTTSSAALSCRHLPSGLSCAFNPATILPPLSVPHTSTLTVAAAPGAFPGTHDIDAVATVPGSAVARHTLQVDVPTAAADFQVKCADRDLDLLPGQAVTLACSVRSLNAFAAPVGLSCGGVGGVTCALAPTSVTPAAGATVATLATVTVSPNHAPGTFTLRLTGTSGGLTRFFDVVLTISTLEP